MNISQCLSSLATISVTISVLWKAMESKSWILALAKSVKIETMFSNRDEAVMYEAPATRFQIPTDSVLRSLS